MVVGMLSCSISTEYSAFRGSFSAFQVQLNSVVSRQVMSLTRNPPMPSGSLTFPS
uniref:Uncharacterized protein n=1 Tax=Anguilla anguilla TaxID=7936 RepID=A0A0E9XRC0_ANGAN